MKRVQGIAGVILLGSSLLGSLLVGLHRVEAAPDPSPMQVAPPPTALSSVWDTRILRWEGLILEHAARRQIDPDLLAALIWRESRGNPSAIGPGGSTGLMQIMPREAGFHWRPSSAELLDPGTNMLWGGGTIAQIIGQARGDVSSALAAYNGGWDKADKVGPQRFAGNILRDYARAVAHRQNVDGHWIAFFAILEGETRGPIWVFDSTHSSLVFHGDTNTTAEGARLIPAVAPFAIVAETEVSDTVLTAGLWLYHVERGEWLAGAAPAPPATSPVPAAELLLPAAVSPAMMAGSAPPTHGQGAPPAPAVQVDTQGVVGDPAVPACEGGPLSVEAYPLERVNTPEGGWVAQIFAQASGGNCAYTYAWNDLESVKGAGVPGSILFEVHSARRDSSLLGTVVVESGQEIVRMRMYVRPPD